MDRTEKDNRIVGAAAVPADEAQRLQSLHALQLLDSPREHAFDWIVQEAARRLDMPIALLSLVDRDRQWFKASVGLAVEQTPRDISFCAHALHSDALMVVEDARLDPRFRDNPLVTGPLGIRFYAGAPVLGPGQRRIGTLCVLDVQPRQLGPRERTDLALLRSLVNADLVQRQLRGVPEGP